MATAFSGAVVPRLLKAPGAPRAKIIAATFPKPNLFEVALGSDASMPVVTATALNAATACETAPAGTCSYLAVVVRDLDGDNIPDVVVIDSSLVFYVRYSKRGSGFVTEHPIPTTTTGFTTVRTSVSGKLLTP
jgi:hypothetical protein